MDALRKVYHRAVQIPLENVETLWSELETFENNLNRITVRYLLFLTAGSSTNYHSHTFRRKSF
jgi:suppressor of forked protein Suf